MHKLFLIDFFRNSICLLKSMFLALLLPNFSTVCAHMLSKFRKKFAQKHSIFSNKASFERSLMKLIAVTFSGCFLSTSLLYSQANYPYSSGQAVFVQSPFNSSLYTTYPYNPSGSAPHRLPYYTTNQAVFVQRPYATAQQTVVSFPTNYANGSPLMDNRYAPPTAFPSTVAPAYPFATTGLYSSSPYNTTVQSSTYNYPYSGTDYTTTYTYPYTTSTQVGQYQTSVVERASSNVRGSSAIYPSPGTQGYPSATYVAYPITIVQKYPYPTTTTAVPETIIEPSKR